MKSIKIYFPIFLLLIVSFFKSCIKAKKEATYTPIKPVATHFNGYDYAGSESCASCHLDIYNSYLKTAHYHTSNIATPTTTKGDFSEKNNTLNIGNEFKIKMIHADSSLYQHSYKTYNNRLLSELKIDIVFGSGRKGQSFLTWKRDKLFQLQASYNSTTKKWVNSPGFPNYIKNSRPITPRCMECHTTYAENTQSATSKNIYKKNELILGIKCERCHGPSAKHVGFHLSNPDITETKFILHNNDFSRQQQLDACAICHSGIRGKPKKLPFSFITGDNLSEYTEVNYNKKEEVNLDVHGNQYGLLSNSKCFKETKTMTCISCHNPHKKERILTSFNTKCINCHANKSITCKEDKQVLLNNNNNCVECHMPLLDSKSMAIKDLTGEQTPIKVRTHLINVYTQKP